MSDNFIAIFKFCKSQNKRKFYFIYLTDCEFEIVLSSVGKEIIQKRLFLKIKFYCLGI